MPKRPKNPAFKTSDGLTNLVSNLGTSKDKRTSTEFSYTAMTRDQLDSMYRSDWLAPKVIDIPVDDMTRSWRTLFAPSVDPLKMEVLRKIEKRLGVKNEFNQAAKWARLYGGSVIVMGLDGTGDQDEPLDLSTVKEGSLKYLVTLDRHDIYPQDINLTDPSQDNYRLPNYYTLNSGEAGAAGKMIHHSRVLRFDGYALPWRLRKQNQYWGGCILERGYSAILNAQGTADNMASLVYESKLDILKVKNLMGILATPNGEQALAERFALADTLKGNFNMLLLDTDEEHQVKNLTFGGTTLPGIYGKFLETVCGAFDIPATRLLGDSASGMNATGEGDLKNYNDMIASKQETDFGTELWKLDNVLTRSAIGFMPEDWEPYFNSLFQLTDEQQATIAKLKSETAINYSGLAILTPDIILKQLKDDGTYSDIDNEYIEAMSKLEAIEPPTFDPNNKNNGY